MQKSAPEIAAAAAKMLRSKKAAGPAVALAELIVDHALNLPLSRLLEPEAVAAQVVRALGSAGLREDLDGHAVPAAELERARVTRTGERVGDLVPEAVRAEIEARLGRPVKLPERLGEGLVDPGFIKELVAGVLTDTLQAFLERLPMGGGVGILGKGGGGGRGGIFGGIGRKVSGNVQRTLSEVARQGAERMKETVTQRLRRPESQEALAAMRHRAVERVMALTLAEVHALGDDPGPAVLARWAEATLRHNAARPELQEALAEHLEAALKRAGKETARHWLETHDLLEAVRAEAIARVAREVRALARGEALKGWLESLLAAAMAR